MRISAPGSHPSLTGTAWVRAAIAVAWLVATAAVSGHGVAGVASAAAVSGHGAAGVASVAAAHGQGARSAVSAVGTRGPVGGAQLAGRGVIVNYPSPRSPRVPKVPAAAFVVADAGTGQVLAAKNAHKLYGPASTLKVLTAISLIPVLDPGAMVLASKRAATTEPDDVGLRRGRMYKVADLFRALLLISGNDAAVALAEATGSFSRGIALMNAEAHHLQAYDTVAKQPNGLDARGQHVSAYDEALIARQALRTPAFLTYDRTLQAWFPITPKHRIQLFNQDKLLTTYRGFIGGKTGWTTPAHATYIGMARRNGHTLIVTLLHAVPGTLFTSATAMLNWGFKMDGKLRPVGWLVPPLPAAPPASHSPAASHPPAATRSAPAAARRIHGSSPGSVLMPVTAGFAGFAAVVLAGYGLARRRRAARGQRA
jgi:serine-type D-Ala-D-Ala carboxypeptidase (penicillin-binding protein 5/6)